MIALFFFFSMLVGYMLGSIPTAVWLGKAFKSVDVREYGSGNAGATNTFRVLGYQLGIPVLIIDVLKGFLAVKAAVYFSQAVGYPQVQDFQFAGGFAAVAGHLYPVFAGFRGGKGIATLLGFILAVEPHASFVCLIIFIFTLLISRIVSLSSMTASLAFPLIVFFVLKDSYAGMKIFSVVIAILVIFTHRKNIQRLIANEESQVRLTFSSNKKNG